MQFSSRGLNFNSHTQYLKINLFLFFNCIFIQLTGLGLDIYLYTHGMGLKRICFQCLFVVVFFCFVVCRVLFVLVVFLFFVCLFGVFFLFVLFVCLFVLFVAALIVSLVDDKFFPGSFRRQYL